MLHPNPQYVCLSAASTISPATNPVQTPEYATPVVELPRPAQPVDVLDCIRRRGYQPLSKVAKSLQGFVIEAQKCGVKYIIKITEKRLVEQKITIQGSRALVVSEDFDKEVIILKYLSMNQAPASLATFVDYFETRDYGYMVQQHAGSGLFEFVRQCHQWILSGRLDLKLWKAFCVTAMRQMTQVVNWLHNTMNCSHLDVSLENFAISKLEVTLDKTRTAIVSIDSGFQIKLIDFGLAEVFPRNMAFGKDDFSCTKYCGKVGYEAPEVLAKQGAFDARSADCFSLAVCFYIMSVGSPPFTKACTSDILFNAVMSKRIPAMLKQWQRQHYVDGALLELLERVFVYEDKRFNISQIAHHLQPLQ